MAEIKFQQDRKRFLILPALCSIRAACAAVPLEWIATPQRPAPATFDRFHGESLVFRCTFSGFGALPFDGASDVRLWYQTNGMGAAWWSLPATVSSNALFATFPPGADPGAERLSVFFGAPSNAYAAAQVRFRNSPGATPNHLDPPSVLDWQAELDTATNSLMSDIYTKDETDARIVELAPSPDMSGVVHGDDREEDKSQFEDGLKFRASDSEGGNMRLRVQDPLDNGISWYSQSSGTTLGSPFFRVNASGIRHPTDRATPYKLSTWDEITRAHSILESMPTHTGQTGNNYEFPVSAGAVLNWFWGLTDFPTGAVEKIRNAVITTNDVCNIATNEVIELSEWKFRGWGGYDLGDSVYEVIELGQDWAGRYEFRLERDGTQIFENALSNGQDPLVLVFEDGSGEGVDATRNRFIRNSLGLARLTDIPTNHVTHAELEEAIGAIPEVDTSNLATKGELSPIQSSVNSMWATLYGENVWITITNYMRQVANTVPSLRLWEVRDSQTNMVYSSAEEIEHVATQKVNEAKLEIKGMIPRTAWGSYQSSGEENPSSNAVTVVNSSKIMLTGGGEWYRTVETGGRAIWVLKTNGMMTLGGDTNGYFRVCDAEGNAQIEVVKTADQTVSAVPSETTFADGDFTVTFNAGGTTHPTASCALDLGDDFETEDGSGNINSLGISISWAKNSDNLWAATVHQDNPSDKLFLYAKALLQGENLVRNNAPTSLDGGIYINNVKYRLVPYSTGGKTYMTLEAWQ